jgi:hypothetical protein
VAKRLGLFDIQKVPEVKNMQKQANLLRSAKTKWKWFVYKIPEINGKHVQVLIKISNY